MPFKKVGKDRYKSPSGRILTKKQVRAYYAKKNAKGMMDAVNRGIKDGSR